MYSPILNPNPPLIICVHVIHNLLLNSVIGWFSMNAFLVKFKINLNKDTYSVLTRENFDIKIS